MCVRFDVGKGCSVLCAALGLVPQLDQRVCHGVVAEDAATVGGGDRLRDEVDDPGVLVHVEAHDLALGLD